jgi:hypothetical protein
MIGVIVINFGFGTGAFEGGFEGFFNFFEIFAEYFLTGLCDDSSI